MSASLEYPCSPTIDRSLVIGTLGLLAGGAYYLAKSKILRENNMKA